MKTMGLGVLAVAVLSFSVGGVARAVGIDLHFSNVNTGSGQTNTFALTQPISGVMTALIPRFNGGLGTLIQADFEFAGDTNGAWQSDPSTTGTIDFYLSGPVDVDGQPMGNLLVGFGPVPIVDYTPIPYGTANFANATFTSGAFFNSLTGVGNVTLTWIYSGTANITVPLSAIGEFDWGGTAHAGYTYMEVPEPASLALLGVGALGLMRRRRKA